MCRHCSRTADFRDARSSEKGCHRIAIGAFTVTAIHDGSVVRERPAGFVRGVAEDVVEGVFAAAGNEPGRFRVTFNPLLVETGTHRILIDTGQGLAGPAGTGRTMSNLAAHGVLADEIDMVLISHYHGDHINGLLLPDGRPAYPNAHVFVPRPEHGFWMASHLEDELAGCMLQTRDAALRIFSTLSDRVETFDWHDEILPGITAIEARGHSPGHTAFSISSGDNSILFAGDIVNNPSIFARFPEWVATFDNQPTEMLATRRQLLGRLADEKALVYFFHANFPGFGRILRADIRFDFVPLSEGAT